MPSLLDLPPELAARGFALRPAAPGDEGFVRDAHRQAYERVVTEQFGAWDPERQAAFAAAALAGPGLMLLERDGVACGYARVDDHDDELGLRELVLVPAEQGRGVGSALLARLQERAAARGAAITLEVLHRNRARALYERCGFVRTSSTPTHHRMRWSPPTGLSR